MESERRRPGQSRGAPRSTRSRLLDRLRQEGVVPEGAECEVYRVHPSASQRNTGAWSWGAAWADPATGRSRAAGSQFSMAACVRAERWDIATAPWGDTEIDPLPYPEPKPRRTQ